MNMIERAESEYARGRLRKALLYFLAAIEENPEDASAHLGAGRCLYHLGRIDEAETRIDNALRLNEQLAPAHVILSQIHAKQGDLLRSEDDARRAVELAPSLSGGHAQLGALLYIRKMQAESLWHLEQAVNLDSHNWYARYWLARHASSFGDHKRGLMESWAALRIMPTIRTFASFIGEFLIVNRIWASLGAFIFLMLAIIYRSPWLLALGLFWPGAIGILALATRRWFLGIALLLAVTGIVAIYVLP
jgi:tetratricopeptide (TPR) repeat protein